MSNYKSRGQLIVLHPRAGSPTSEIAGAHATDHSTGCRAEDAALARENRAPSDPCGADILVGPGYSSDTSHAPTDATQTRAGPEDKATHKAFTFHDLCGGTEIADTIVRTHQDVLMQAKRLKK